MPDGSSQRGGYFWIGHQNEFFLADGKITIMTIPTFFPKRPGYVHNVHIAFLDSMAEAVAHGLRAAMLMKPLCSYAWVRETYGDALPEESWLLHPRSAQPAPRATGTGA